MGWYCDTRMTIGNDTELAARIREICDKGDLKKYNVFNEFFPLPDNLHYQEEDGSVVNSDEFVLALDSVYPCSREKLREKYLEQVELIRKDYSSIEGARKHGLDIFNGDVSLATEQIPALLSNLDRAYDSILRTGWSSWYSFMMKNWGCTGCENQDYRISDSNFIFHFSTYKSDGIDGILNISKLYPDTEIGLDYRYDFDDDNGYRVTIRNGEICDRFEYECYFLAISPCSSDFKILLDRELELHKPYWEIGSYLSNKCNAFVPAYEKTIPDDETFFRDINAVMEDYSRDGLLTNAVITIDKYSLYTANGRDFQLMKKVGDRIEYLPVDISSYCPSALAGNE